MKPDNKSKPWQDRETLRHLYHDKRMSQQEIADHFDNEVTQAGIGYCLDKYDIEKRSRSESAKVRWLKTPMKLHSNTKYGYEYVAERSGDECAMVLLHRLLAVHLYGFEEIRDKVVHHKNEIPWDNRPDNIELMTAAEHASYHHTNRVQQ